MQIWKDYKIKILSDMCTNSNGCDRMWLLLYIVSSSINLSEQAYLATSKDTDNNPTTQMLLNVALVVQVNWEPVTKFDS